MKIITGKLKGLALKSPEVNLRPTQDKVRKAIFDILAGCIKGVNFLELFAGSGAVGIEALSCGAGFVCFVENDRESIGLLRENLARARVSNYAVKPLDAFTALELFAKENKSFDIIFIDPPYYEDLAKKFLLSLSAYDILTSAGFVIIQHFKKDVIPEETGSFKLFKQKFYGDTVVSFYQMKPELTERKRT
ncbi:MAG: 16S rRNA (guanine(966)-N(2))-methyltransferase RsmD [Candidatus Omnitrophota bacterium]